jgi:hypothetical protein
VGYAPRTIEFRANHHVAELELVLSDRPTRIPGTLTDERGRPATDYAVVVFASDRNRWGYGSRHLAMARPDQNGAFLIEKLPPAEYFAIAVDSIEEGEWTDPELLQRMQFGATRFTLSEGERKPLMLKLTTAIR